MHLVSMEEWQNHLRVQKEDDRQKKQQSQQILNNFRAAGIKDEDEIQKKLRLEAQQKKKDAAAYLHNYRPSILEDIEGVPSTKKNPSQAKRCDGPLPPVVAAPGKADPRNAIAAGAVSSMAANFTGSGNSGSPSSRNCATIMRGNGNEYESGYSLDHDNASNSDADEPIHIDLSEEGTSSQSTSNSAQEWVQVTSEDCVPMVVSDNENGEEEPHFIRLDVDFSFGLISTKEKPSFEHYMNAVEEVVQGALKDTPNSELKHHLSYDPMYAPFVQNVQNDGMYFLLACVVVWLLDTFVYVLMCPCFLGCTIESYLDAGGRSNVQRLLVRAVVPVFHSKGIMAKKARSFVIKALAAALKRGYFLQIAERDCGSHEWMLHAISKRPFQISSKDFCPTVYLTSYFTYCTCLTSR